MWSGLLFPLPTFCPHFKRILLDSGPKCSLCGSSRPSVFLGSDAIGDVDLLISNHLPTSTFAALGMPPDARTVNSHMQIKPGTLPPRLSLPLTSGGSTDDLYLGTGEGGRFTVVVFYRGLHCPMCRRQLSELDKRLDELRDVGVGRVVAVSMESAERSTEVVKRWQLTNLPVAYELTEDDAREWGLFISTAIKEGEPGRFSEPGIFILDYDGTVYWSSVASMPFGRPPLDEIIAGIVYANEHNYPARGAA